MKYDPMAIERKRKRDAERCQQDAQYRKRFAYEWLMKAEDSRYWQLTVEYVNDVHKRTTAIAVASVVVAVVALLFSIFGALR